MENDQPVSFFLTMSTKFENTSATINKLSQYAGKILRTLFQANFNGFNRSADLEIKKPLMQKKLATANSPRLISLNVGANPNPPSTNE
jgi:hypothetical protein